MMGFIIGLLLLFVLFWVGMKLTGALLLALVWLFIKVPLALVFWSLGLALCCTLILIPVGLGFWKTGLRLLLP